MSSSDGPIRLAALLEGVSQRGGGSQFHHKASSGRPEPLPEDVLKMTADQQQEYFLWGVNKLYNLVRESCSSSTEVQEVHQELDQLWYKLRYTKLDGDLHKSVVREIIRAKKLCEQEGQKLQDRETNWEVKEQWDLSSLHSMNLQNQNFYRADGQSSRTIHSDMTSEPPTHAYFYHEHYEEATEEEMTHDERIPESMRMRAIVPPINRVSRDEED